MSLNDIQLNNTLLAELYARSLVVIEDAAADSSELPAPSTVDSEITSSGKVATEPLFLGNNQKKISIIVQYTGLAHMPDDILQFLTKMLEACQLSLGDVAIHNFSSENNFVAKDITRYLQSRVVLLFGVPPDSFGLAIQFPFFQIQPLAGITYLYAPSLEECRDDKLLKSKLWVSLQRIFII